MSEINLDQYTTLMDSFVQGKISATDFEAAYLAMFKADSRPFPSSIYRILNKLFSDVDMFVSDPGLREVADLDESALLESAKKARSELARVLSMKSS